MEKRREIFLKLREECDILCLQETHSKVESESFWQNEWGGKCIFSHGTSASKGVMICFKKNLDYKIMDMAKDNAGRYLVVQIKIDTELYVITNIYGPNSDSPSFFTEIFRKIDKLEGFKILVGDFNCTLEAIDRKGSKTYATTASAEICKNYMQEANLVDIWRTRNPEALRYTWARPKQKIASRLDYFLIDAGIEAWTKTIKIKEGYKTDHKSVELELNPHITCQGSGIWKINNNILRELEFVERMNQIIDETVRKSHRCNKRDRWEMIKLEAMAFAKQYSRLRAQNFRTAISVLEEKIEYYENSDHTNPLLERSKQDLQEIIEERTRGAIFRSKAQWYNEAEMPTKYFLNLEKSRARQKNMAVLIRPDGTETTNPVHILNEQKDFYAELYQKDDSVCFNYENIENIKITDTEIKSMEKDIEINELTEALRTCKRNKTPGCDGLSSEFYVVFWDKIKEYLLDALQEGLQTGYLHASALKGVITTIPKKGKDCRQIKNLRPITLLNTDYKLLEKVYALRLKPILQNLIDLDQKGFLPGRRISANIRCIIDIMNKVNSEETDGIIMSIDYEKCFDRISHSSLLSAMEYFDFPKKFINNVATMYRNANSVVINNGFVSDSLQIQRGCKQGAPCSAYFFLICAELLAIKLRKNNEIKGFHVGDFKKLFGQFADDIDLYCRNTNKNITEILKTLDIFCSNTGLKVNTDKTTVFPIGKKRSIDEKFGLKIEREKINVLGVWLHENIKTTLDENYQDLIRKTKAIMQDWKHRQLSLLGKAVVYNTLIASLYVYKMMVLPTIPNHYLTQIEKMLTEFLWNGAKPKISLEKLYAPVEKGGINLVNLKLKDASLKFSWITAMREDKFSQENAYYNLHSILRKDIWLCELNENDIISTFKPSFWRDVLSAYNVYRKAVQINSNIDHFLWFNSAFRIKDKVYFVKEAYLNGLSYVSQLKIDGEYKSANVISREFNIPIMTANAILSSVRNVKNGFIKHGENLLDITEKLKKPASVFYKKCNTTNHDSLWALYIKWQSTMHTDLDFNGFIKLFRNIKKCTNHAKLRSFQIRLLNNAIITKKELKKWNIVSNDNCHFCNSAQETVIHLFYECPNAKYCLKKVVEYTNKRTGMENFADRISAENVIFNNFTGDNSQLINFLLLVMKQFIYAQKCRQLSCINIMNRFDECKKCEYYNAKQKGKMKVFQNKWENYEVSEKSEDLSTNLLEIMLSDTLKI